MAEKFVSLMLKRRTDLFAYRAIVWLKRSIEKGAPKEVGSIIEILENAAAKKDVGLLKKAQKQLQQMLKHD